MTQIVGISICFKSIVAIALISGAGEFKRLVGEIMTASVVATLLIVALVPFFAGTHPGGPYRRGGEGVGVGIATPPE